MVKRSRYLAARLMRVRTTPASQEGRALPNKHSAGVPVSERLWQAMPDGQAVDFQRIAQFRSIRREAGDEIERALLSLESVSRIRRLDDRYEKISQEGIHRHPPGKLSRWGVVDVGLKCTHSCQHCFYSFMDGSDDQFAGMRHARWHKLENLLEVIDGLADSGFIGFDITGGEPTAYPHIVELVAYGVKRGLAPRIITLGQFLTRKGLLERLLDAGVADFRFSLHAIDPAMFNRMTGGDVGRLMAAMDELQRRDFHYITNTTITEQNWQALPDIARWIAKRPEIYQTTWLFFMPYYEWNSETHGRDHRVRYSDIAVKLKEAVRIVEEAGIGCTIRYAPQCTIAGMERNHVGITGVRHDPHEWMNAIDHRADPERVSPAMMRNMGKRLPLRDSDQGEPLQRGTEFFAERGDKVFPEKCRNCHAFEVCDGVDRRYLAEHGDTELKPFTEFRGKVIDLDRAGYLPGFVSKTAPFADARGAVRAAFEEIRSDELALAK
jgi:pyrroloquinoline quinone biosynthesis protein E